MFVDSITAIILGLVEGVTEFLPISSTGHLIIINQWLHFSPAFTSLFDIVIQLGAIAAVVIYFRKRLWPFHKNPPQKKSTKILWYKTLLAVFPALVIGALFGQTIEEKLFHPLVVAIALFVGGIILVCIDKKTVPPKILDIEDLSYQKALCIGLIQCLAMIPGTSRSAATIVGARLLGANRKVSVEFSFFLAIPTMVAAAAYSLLSHGTTITLRESILLGIGFITALTVALVVIRYVMQYVQRHDFAVFGYYRLALGTLIFLFFFLR